MNNVRTRLRASGWIFAALGISIALAATAFYERAAVIAACGGEFVYPIDDTYIHIAMAKCLGLGGTWGVEAGKTAFCSSSPLWTLLLAGIYRVFGVSESVPWYLCLGFNVGTLFVVCRLLAVLRTGALVQLAGATVTAAAGPFICTTALGMEHAMHAFFVISALGAAWGMADGRRFCRWIAPLLAAAATATRYESLFLLLPLGCGLCGLEAWKRWKSGEKPLPSNGLVFLFASVLPVIAYGVWAISSGGHFLPNSLLFKGSFGTMALLRKAMALMGSVRPGWGFLYLLAVAIVTAGVLPRTTLFWRLAAFSVAIAIGGQLLFADVGQLCRYEAFLTSTGAFVWVVAVVQNGLGLARQTMVPTAVSLVLAAVFLPRAGRAMGAAIHSSADVKSVQVFVTRMLSAMPEADRGCVALNDLGYMVLHGKLPILDIWGLGSQDAAELILQSGRRWTREANEVLFKKHGVKYVVVFEEWFPPFVMPEGTVDVAKMKLQNNLACGADTVVFRATSTESADALERRLEACADKLPPRIMLTFCR